MLIMQVLMDASLSSLQELNSLLPLVEMATPHALVEMATTTYIHWHLA